MHQLVDWSVVFGCNATLTVVISWWRTCVSWLSHTSTNTTFLSKATDYFSHMLLQRWEAKIRQKESSPQPRIKLTTTRSWVRQAHHWATRAGRNAPVTLHVHTNPIAFLKFEKKMHIDTAEMQWKNVFRTFDQEHATILLKNRSERSFTWHLQYPNSALPYLINLIYDLCLFSFIFQVFWKGQC